jgi:hypothetical protein
MYKYERMTRYILNEVETSHHLIFIRLYFTLTILITEDDHNHFFLTIATQLGFFFITYKCGHRNVLSKRQVLMSIFLFINLKKKKKIMDTGVLEIFNKKLILDYYFCLKSGPVFLFQIFIIATLRLPRDIQLYH